MCVICNYDSVASVASSKNDCINCRNLYFVYFIVLLLNRDDASSNLFILLTKLLYVAAF